MTAAIFRSCFTGSHSGAGELLLSQATADWAHVSHGKQVCFRASVVTKVNTNSDYHGIGSASSASFDSRDASTIEPNYTYTLPLALPAA